MKFANIKADTEYVVIQGQNWRNARSYAVKTAKVIGDPQADRKPDFRYESGAKNHLWVEMEVSRWTTVDGKYGPVASIESVRVPLAQVRCTLEEWKVIDAGNQAAISEAAEYNRQTENIRKAWQARCQDAGVKYQRTNKVIEFSYEDAEAVLGALEDGSLVLPSTTKVTA